jgi:hypothetical protein
MEGAGTMIEAKDCPRSLSPWMVTFLGLGLIFTEAGCSGMTGLRSVGTERPSLLGLWDRNARGTPTPENDSYVLNMRAGQARADALAKRDELSADGQGGSLGAAGDQVADAADDGRPQQDKGPRRPAVPDEKTIRVSLGRPEPLPGLAGPEKAPAELAAAGPASPRWKAEATEEDGDEKEEIAQPARSTRMAERKPATSEREWKAILSRAGDKLAALKTYQMKVTRVERVNGKLQPEEEILLSIRRAPQAVRLEWENGPSKGREVIYSQEIDPRMLFVHMPSKAISLPVMKFPVDSPLVMRNSRHAITEAGLDTIVANLRKADGGDGKKGPGMGELKYKGIEKPAGVDSPCHHFARRTSAGETWNVYLDERSLLPRMVFSVDSHGETIERYLYRDIRENPADLSTAAAFAPDQRWGESKNFLSRFARAGTGTDLPGTSNTTTR